MAVKRFDNGGILVAEILEDQNEKLSVFCYVSTNTKEIVEPIHDVVYHDYRKARIVYEHNIPETERWMYVLRSFGH